MSDGAWESFTWPEFSETPATEAELERARLTVLEASIADAQRALARAARINVGGGFRREVRALAQLAEHLDRRVLEAMNGRAGGSRP